MVESISLRPALCDPTCFHYNPGSIGRQRVCDTNFGGIQEPQDSLYLWRQVTYGLPKM
jgi:hypothetical protein